LRNPANKQINKQSENITCLVEVTTMEHRIMNRKTGRARLLL